MNIHSPERKKQFVLMLSILSPLLFLLWNAARASQTINAAGTIITAYADDDYGNCTITPDYSNSILYTIDNANNFTLKVRTRITSASQTITLYTQPRVADDVSIPLYFTIDNFTGGTGSWCAVRGTIWNGSTNFIENITVTGDGDYFTTNYFKSLTATLGWRCGNGGSGSFNATLFQRQWGAVGKDPKSAYQYFTIASLLLVNNTTTPTCLSESYKQIYLVSGGGSYYYQVNGSSLSFGTIVDEATKTTAGPVMIYRQGTSQQLFATYGSGTFDFYGGTITSTGTTNPQGARNRFWHTIFGTATFGWTTGALNMDLYDVTMLEQVDAIFKGFFNGTVDGLTAYGGQLWSTGPVTMNASLRNIRLIGNTQFAAASSWTGYMNLTNSYADNYDVSFIGGIGPTFYLLYVKNFNITDGTSPINDTEINITETCSGDYWGLIPSQYSLTTDENGFASVDVVGSYIDATGKYDCNNLVFTISKSGYETLNFTANITEETDWTLTLFDSSAIIFMSYDAGIMIGFTAISGLLLYFGIQIGKSDNKVYRSSQMIFIILGFYLMLLTITIGRTMASSGGASQGTLDTIDVGITLITWLVVIFLFIFILVFIYTALMAIKTKSKEASKLPTV